MTLNLLKRGEKGSALTAAEHDSNFSSIESEVNAKANSSSLPSFGTAAEADTADFIPAADAPTGDIVGTTDTQTLTGKTLGNLAETVFTITDGASVDLDPADGPIQLWTLGGDRTPTASSFANGQVMTLLINDGTGFSITWPSVAWIDGQSAPTLETDGFTSVLLFKTGGTLYGKAGNG